MTSPSFDRAYRLTPGIQRYAWGDPDFVPDLLGIPNLDRAPHAEVWMGAHPACPATVLLPKREVGFDELIARHGSAFLGADVMDAFGGMPYLMKVLAAAGPLSIQVHPTKAQAEEGYRREEAAGIPGDAPHRNYRDTNHKPEVLVALTPFHALCGFRPLEEIEQVLGGLEELRGMLPPFVPTADGLRAVVEAYLTLPDDRLHPALTRLVQRLRDERRDHSSLDDPVYWLLEADRLFSQRDRPDRGLLFVLLLELVRLDPGEAMFLRAGTLHAYLKGAGVEVMASSDNVLRCGLTQKHVNAAELLRIVDFGATGAARVRPASGRTPGERAYETPAREFALAELTVTPGQAMSAVARGTDTLIVTGGEVDVMVRVATPGGPLELPRGGVCVVPHGVAYSLTTTGQATLFRTSVCAGSHGTSA